MNGHLPEHAQSVGYDWSRFGRHRFRSPAGVLVDWPLDAGPTVWLATIWPAPAASGEWARLMWQHDNRLGGWALPPRLAGGDIVEFGADHAGHVARWYGIVDSYDGVEWLSLQGPYNEPAAANAEAERLLARIRYEPPRRARATRRPCARPRPGT